MPFGLAEILADGWLMRDEVLFAAQESAITVALAWSRGRGLAHIGVAEIETRKLVWRSDCGTLSLPCLGTKSKSG